MEMHCANVAKMKKNSKYPDVQDLMKYYETIIKFAVVG